MIVNKVIKVKVEQITTDPNNPNEMTDDEMNRLRKSMDHYGFLFPIIIDQNNVVVDGEHRFLIFKEKGLKEIPCVQMNFQNDAQRRALRQATNKIHGNHNLQKDIEELEIILKDEGSLLKDLLDIESKDIEDLKKAANLSNTAFFKEPLEKPDKADDVMRDIGMKKSIHLLLNEEVINRLDHIIEEEDLEDYNHLIEFLVSKY